MVDVQVDVLGMGYYIMTYKDDAEAVIAATEDSTDITEALPNAKHSTLSLSFNGVQYTSNDAFSFKRPQKAIFKTLPVL